MGWMMLTSTVINNYKTDASNNLSCIKHTNVKNYEVKDSNLTLPNPNKQNK